MSRNQTILNLIWQWSQMVGSAKRIKQDPEKRQKTVRFGISAVLYGLMTILCACALLLFQFVGDEIVVSFLCIIAGAAIGGFGTLVSLITALLQWFCQLSLNKRPVTWISLVLMLLCFVVAALIPLVGLTA